MSFTPDLLLEAEPLVSCIMPTLGRPDFVHEAVAFFLWQDYPRKELIVLNDCPGQDFVGEYCGVRFINRDARFATLGEKRNACIEAASGSLIAVWDDDDVYLPWRLSYTVRAMRENRTHFFRAAEFWAYWGEAKLHDNQSVPGWISHQNTLFSKDLWREVGAIRAASLARTPSSSPESTGFSARNSSNIRLSRPTASLSCGELHSMPTRASAAVPSRLTSHRAGGLSCRARLPTRCCERRARS